jgi:hypothetical protein
MQSESYGFICHLYYLRGTGSAFRLVILPSHGTILYYYYATTQAHHDDGRNKDIVMSDSTHSNSTSTELPFKGAIKVNCFSNS